MIAYLSGKLKFKTIDSVIIDVGGVGYDVYCPLSSFSHFPELGSDLSLHIHTHVKEDILQLYGFPTPDEKKLFKTLLGINGIGPKVGISILSHMSAAEFTQVICEKNAKRFKSVPGIGPKMAERIILELKDKTDKLFPQLIQSENSQKQVTLSDENLTEDLVSALMNLGYSEKIANKTVQKSLQMCTSHSFDQVLKHTLKSIST